MEEEGNRREVWFDDELGSVPANSSPPTLLAWFTI